MRTPGAMRLTLKGRAKMTRVQNAVSVITTGCFLALLTSGVAAQSRSDWQAVVALQPGVLLRVDTFSRERLRGPLQRVDNDRLTLAVSTGPVDIPRGSVRRVIQIGDRHVGRDARRGLLVGAAAGGTLGALAAETNKRSWSALMAAGWGAIGSLIGAINGLDRDQYLWYDSPMPQTTADRGTGSP
jgi:hypothetical protein